MAFLGLPGGSEWILILLVVLILFGPTQIPKLAKMLGKSKRALEDGLADKGDDDADSSGEAKAEAKVDDGDKE